ncbi:hypothetical protein JB92DRAFT_2851975, partial [Gautieria morchelliformis]
MDTCPTRRNHIQHLEPHLNCSCDRLQQCRRAQPEALHSSKISRFFRESLGKCKDILQFLKDLTEENTALLHGGPQDRVLGKLDLILFDITGTLHGYYSDNTRTFALE